MGKKSRQKWLNREEENKKSNIKKKKLGKLFKLSIIIVVILAVLGAGGFFTWKNYFKPKDNKTKEVDMATIETKYGNVRIKLFPNSAPKTVENFIKLANESFYNGTKFHRVIQDFMIQGGDPLSKDDTKKDQWGSGGPDYKFTDEINPWGLGVDDATIKANQDQGYVYDRKLNSIKNTPGSVAMANSGPNTNGSQFFIITEKDQPHLDGKHTVFGKVVTGMDIVEKIAAVEVDNNDQPKEDVVIDKITISKEVIDNKIISVDDKTAETSTPGFKVETVGGSGGVKVEEVETE